MHIIGSKSSSTTKFLEEVKPSIVLIGAGVNNKFGHPNNVVIERFQSMNCKIYRTDENGEIIIKSNGKYVISNYENNLHKLQMRYKYTTLVNNKNEGL